jgi:acetyltransferase
MAACCIDPDSRDYFANAYQYLFEPRTIVVVGASNDALKPGGRAMKNIVDHGYRGKL